MSQPTKVQIVSNTINTYSQLMRACISGMNAASKLHDDETRSKFADVLAVAQHEHDLLIRASCADNPAIG